jgi:hypothetical protein
VRDAGNLAESEANIQATNVYPGAAGAAAHRDALATSTDQIIKGEPVDVAAHITPAVEASADERIRPLMEARAAAQRAEAAASAAEPAGPAPELPFEQTAAQAEAARATDALAAEVSSMAEHAGYDMSAEEAKAVAARMVKAPDDQVAQALDRLAISPSRAVEPVLKAQPETGAPATVVPPTEVARVIGSPDHDAALRADIDRARMMGDRRLPAGVDENGEPVFRSLDGAMEEVDAYKAAADHIQACVNPPQEPANG